MVATGYMTALKTTDTVRARSYTPRGPWIDRWQTDCIDGNHKKTTAMQLPVEPRKSESDHATNGV